ncbi:AAC(3) family N-acetyltransferase [Pullulanibacillus sp. KACC 23026]|uniref:aminoglycoside N(3)-acetyltransferase n=1 Tax=Pullulanibacillus sp. KACC 23026 TaxID=3028315 RepID=UPI0023B09764|nr:AAC(3) family N-acetyltransferase [Pullulanibacillus sp. KACC 23026]WEG12768.1 AAC(3) family N-acetyltransferase [Pullulanibacillus sp. KACC 23026]
MSENELIKMTKEPNTRESMRSQFRLLGIQEGMTVIVHSSLKSLGWVSGGAVAVVQALMDAVGEMGTIVMPTQSADNSDPSDWENPPVPESWWKLIRETWPAYDPQYTPTRGMGQIVEVFRTFPGVKRSKHPALSFAAWGKEADAILSDQTLEEAFGHGSPLEKIYERNGYVLLIGVTHDSNTSLHLAEHFIPGREKDKKGAAVLINGERQWVTYEETRYDSDPFEELGSQFEKENPISTGFVGNAFCRLMEQRLIVDYAKDWLIQHVNEIKS